MYTGQYTRHPVETLIIEILQNFPRNAVPELALDPVCKASVFGDTVIVFRHALPVKTCADSGRPGWHDFGLTNRYASFGHRPTTRHATPLLAEDRPDLPAMPEENRGHRGAQHRRRAVRQDRALSVPALPIGDPDGHIRRTGGLL